MRVTPLRLPIAGNKLATCRHAHAGAGARDRQSAGWIPALRQQSRVEAFGSMAVPLPQARRILALLAPLDPLASQGRQFLHPAQSGAAIQEQRIDTRGRWIAVSPAGGPISQGRAQIAAGSYWGVVRRPGLEPGTHGLKGRCSTN